MIAETTDLPTRYSKTVVTGDRGRYLIVVHLVHANSVPQRNR